MHSACLAGQAGCGCTHSAQRVLAEAEAEVAVMEEAAEVAEVDCHVDEACGRLAVSRTPMHLGLRWLSGDVPVPALA